MQAANTKERKQDTHQKIQLGGLVVKAGLREINKAVLLAWLMRLQTKLDTDPSLRLQLEAEGQEGMRS